MTKQQRAHQEMAPDLSELAEPIERIATKLADVSSELGSLGEHLRAQRIGLEEVRRPDPDGQPVEQPPPETRRGGRPHEVSLGEPVDTSFTKPTQTPAAEAAGASPSGGMPRWTVLNPGRPHLVAWVGSAVVLFGILLVLFILAWM